MTVPSQQSSVRYQTDGSTTNFPVPFYFIANAHLVVSIGNDSYIQTLTLGSDYSVTGAGQQSGGTVTLNAQQASGLSLFIERRPPFTQETAYQRNDAFPERAHERALDKLTMLAQGLNIAFGRSIQFPVEFPLRGATLPRAALRANKAITFDANGNVTVDAYVSQADAAAQYGALLSHINSGDAASRAHSDAEDIRTRYYAEALLAGAQGGTGYFMQDGLGAIERTFQDKLRDNVSVTDYVGADATGITSSDAAIKAAYAVSDTVHFPDGKYTTSLTETRRYSGPGVIRRVDGTEALNFINLQRQRVFVIGLTGQSNAAGANSGGPNPANPLVKVWNDRKNTWGSSNYTLPPFSHPTPTGNGANNNIGLAFAHRLADELGAKVYLIYDASGGKPIEDWIDNGVDSVRYKAFSDKARLCFQSPELVEIKKTNLDFLIFAQGEANAKTDTVLTYQEKLKTLDKQFRAESWMDETTPLFITGMSGLHNRYQVWQAQLSYCENVNRNCIYVNSAGLKTGYDVDPTSGEDYTHFLGQSLWDMGYHRIWNANNSRGTTHRQPPAAFWARGTGVWEGGTIAIAGFSSLIGEGSATNRLPYNGPGSSNSISWGAACSAANNGLAGGADSTQNSLARYSVSWGRSLAATSGSDYSAMFGFQNTASAPYSFVSGRGNTVADAAGTALGTFCRYTTPQADPVLLQVGCGTSASVARNAITVRASGLVEINANPSGNPTRSGEITFRRVNNWSLQILMMGSDGVVRGATIVLS